MSNPPFKQLNFLVFAASLREGSLNRRIAMLAKDAVEANGGLVDFVEFEQLDVSSYNKDSQDAEGFPAGAVRFKAMLEKCDGLIIASPEYNFSMPGALKNLIDWTSRYRPHPFKGLHCLLMSASPSMAGGNRGLWALRIPLEHLGMHVFPEMFSLAQAHQAFDDDGRIANTQLQEWFDGNIAGFYELVEAAKRYPCVKQRWIEFPGEAGPSEALQTEGARS